MDFVSDILVILLFIACIVIVLIFLYDYFRLLPLGKEERRPGEMVRVFGYKLFYGSRVIDRGSFKMEDLPVQFGRVKAEGVDVWVFGRHKEIPEEEFLKVSRFWFYLTTNASGQPVLCRGREGAGQQEEKPLVIVTPEGREREEYSVRLESGLTVSAGSFKVTFDVREEEKQRF